MSFTFRPAVREQTPLLIGLAGPSGSGKTKSALRLAAGLAQGRPVYGIDTERGRMALYAGIHNFEHGRLTEPFRPQRYQEAVLAAEAAGAGAIIVDSMSHGHEGPGGILEWHAELVEQYADTAGKSVKEAAKARERVNFKAWIEPKAAHNRFVNTVLQMQTHCIFCFRAKEKIELRKVKKQSDDGRREFTVTDVVPMGWQPICADRFEYEMTALLMLPPRGEGVPDLTAGATKLPEMLRPLIREGEQLSEQTGQRLAEWARGGAAMPEARPSAEDASLDLLRLARDAANDGLQSLETWWKTRSKDERKALEPHKEALKRMATGAADEAPLLAGAAA